jgi:hypothetical protein
MRPSSFVCVWPVLSFERGDLYHAFPFAATTTLQMRWLSTFLQKYMGQTSFAMPINTFISELLTLI